MKGGKRRGSRPKNPRRSHKQANVHSIRPTLSQYIEHNGGYAFVTIRRVRPVAEFGIRVWFEEPIQAAWMGGEEFLIGRKHEPEPGETYLVRNASVIIPDGGPPAEGYYFEQIVSAPAGGPA